MHIYYKNHMPFAHYQIWYIKMIIFISIFHVSNMFYGSRHCNKILHRPGYKLTTIKHIFSVWKSLTLWPMNTIIHWEITLESIWSFTGQTQNLGFRGYVGSDGKAYNFNPLENKLKKAFFLSFWKLSSNPIATAMS